jgi:fatty acid desaturase
MNRRRSRKLDILNGAIVMVLAAVSAVSLFTLHKSLISQELLVCALLANTLIQSGVQMRLELLQHEAVHNKLFHKKFFNHFIGEFFCSLPLLSSLDGYRRFHYEHHKFLGNLALDPEVKYYHQQKYRYVPLSPRQLIRNTVFDLSGFHFLQFHAASLLDDARSGNLWPNIRVATWHMGFLLITGLKLYFLGWLLPMATVKFCLSKLQGLSEHIIYQRPSHQFGHTVAVGPITKFILFPLNANLHLIHHLEPNLPWFSLPSRLSRYDTWHKIDGVFHKNGILGQLTSPNRFNAGQPFHCKSSIIGNQTTAKEVY